MAPHALSPTEVFVRRLREVRNDRGLSQTQLAQAMSAVDRPLSKSALLQLENGRRGLSIDEALAFPEVLETVPAHFFLPPKNAVIRVSRRQGFDGDGFRSWFRTGYAFADLESRKRDIKRWERRGDEQPVIRAALALIDAVRTGDDGARQEALRAVVVAASKLEAR